MHFFKQNDSLTVLAQCVICKGEYLNKNEASVGGTCSIFWGRLKVYVLIFWGYDRYRLVLYRFMTLPTGYVFVAEAVTRNFRALFLMVLRSGTVPCLRRLKCRLNIRCVITESLSL